jgi:hypothetical protein
MFDEIVDVLLKQQVLVPQSAHRGNIKLPSAAGLAHSNCSMARISGCRGFRRSSSFP